MERFFKALILASQLTMCNVIKSFYILDTHLTFLCLKFAYK